VFLCLFFGILLSPLIAAAAMSLSDSETLLGGRRFRRGRFGQ